MERPLPTFGASARFARAAYAPHICTLIVALLAPACGDSGADLDAAAPEDSAAPDGAQDAATRDTAIEDAAARDDGGDPTDAGERFDGDAPDAPSAERALVASSTLGAFYLSCDDGRSWEQTLPGTALRCTDEGVDCSDVTEINCRADGTIDCTHGEQVNQGLTYNGEAFFAAFGWPNADGQVPRFLRSFDARRWDVVFEAPDRRLAIGGGLVATSAGHVIGLRNRAAVRSVDNGETWEELDHDDATWETPRTFRRLVLPSGELLVGHRENTVTRLVMSDDGETWRGSRRLDDACATTFRAGGGAFAGLSAVGDTVVMARHISSGGRSSIVCRSLDRGETFEVSAMFPGIHVAGATFSVGDELWFYPRGAGRLLRTGDGVNWEESETTFIEARADRSGDFSASLRTSSGAFVASGGAYDSQRFYRSEDGITWDVIPGLDGHGIRYIREGRLSECGR